MPSMQPIDAVDGELPPSTWLYEQSVRLGADIRLLLEHKGTHRRMLYLSLRPDGSIVCGPGKGAARIQRSARRRGSDAPLPAPLASSLGEMPFPPGFHITFHGSGVINDHAGGARTYRAPLHGDAPHQLCRFSLEHPDFMETTKPRDRDLIVPGELNLDYAWQGSLVIVPKNVAVFFDDVEAQIAMILHGRRTDQSVAYRLQVSLHCARHQWPTETAIEWVSRDPDRARPS